MRSIQGRRANNEGSITKKIVRGKIKWRASIRLNIDGKPTRKERYGNTRQEVHKKLTELKRQAEAGELISRKPETLDAYLKRWATDPDLRPKSRVARETNRQRIEPILGSRKLSDITAQNIDRLYQHLKSYLSPASVLQCHRVLGKALKDAVTEGVIPRNPMDQLVRKPNGKHIRKRQVVLSAEQINHLLSVGNEWRALWIFLLGTGVRSAEAAGLPWSNINMDEGTILINQQVYKLGSEFIVQSPKTQAGTRLLHAPEAVIAALYSQYQTQRNRQIILGDAWMNTHDLCFTRDNGAPLAGYHIYSAFQRTLKTSGLPSIRVHDLRHTYSSHAIRLGISANVLKDALGHENISTTLDIYSHIFKSQQEELATTMNGILSKT
tara:strand:+ start:10716 stop:11858 length:1143 start_codon:yes stop_codon:yes gene_type:complete